MIIRALTTAGDWQFGQGLESYVADEAAIGENIKTRILSFLGNCWWDMAAGINWFIYFGTPGTQQQTLLSIKAVVLQSYGVVAINNISLTTNPNKRSAIISMNIRTIFSVNYQQNLQVINYAQNGGQ